MTTNDAGGSRQPVSLAASIALVGTLGTIYMVSQFLRNSIGVIAPNLAAELSMSASEIGLLSSTFFFSFAGAQIPLGIALDRYGPRACMLVCSVIAVAGAILFAMAHTPALSITARALMGLGSSCYLMAPLALYAQRYAPERFSMLVGLQLGIGSVGTLLATAPLAFSTTAIGWRATFLVVAGIVAIMSVLVAFVVRQDRAAELRPRETFAQSIAGVIEALRTPSILPLFLMQLATYSSFVLIVGLWGGPYLTHIYGYDLPSRGEILFLAAAGQIAGSFALGPLDRVFGNYKAPVFLGLLLTSLSLGALALFGQMPVAWAIACFIGVGFFSAYTSILIAHGKSLFPPRLVGRGMTLLNMGTMGGVFFTQTISGFVIDFFPAVNGAYPLEAYRVVFAIQVVFLIVAGLSYMTARDPRRAL